MKYQLKLEDNKFFAKELVNKVAAWNQSADVNICGDRGLGKSHTGMRLAMQCAEIMAEKYGGVWQDYWNLEENTGIMNLSEIIAVSKVMSETQSKVFLIDDLSVSQNARKHGTVENQALNSMLTVGRMNKHICIRSFPHTFMVDKYVRHLCNYLVEMQKPYFEYGYTSAKIFVIKSQRDGSEPHESYLQNRFGEKYMRAFFRDVPKDIVEKYDARRMIAQKELERNSIANLTKSEDTKNAPTKENKKEIILKGHLEWMEGKFGDMTWRNWCDSRNISYDYANNLVSKNKIVKNS